MCCAACTLLYMLLMYLSTRMVLPLVEEETHWADQSQRAFSLPMAIAGLPFTVFFGLVCYALSVSNTAEVQAACGSSLWNLVLAHLVVPMGLSIVIIVATVGFMICCFGFSDYEEPNLPIVFGMVAAGVIVLYCSLFLGMGVPIIQDAMSSEICKAELSRVSFTETPLLGILGCFYLVTDGLLLFLVTMCLLLAGCLA